MAFGFMPSARLVDLPRRCSPLSCLQYALYLQAVVAAAANGSGDSAEAFESPADILMR